MIVNRTPITVRGRVIATRPLKRTATGSDVIGFRIAANERAYDQATGTWSDIGTFYIQVTAWDALARRAAVAALDKQMVVVQGTISTHSYEKNGEPRSYPEIRAQAIAVDLLSMDKNGRSVRETEQSADPISRLAGVSGQDGADSLDDDQLAQLSGQSEEATAADAGDEEAERVPVGAGVGASGDSRDGEEPPF